MINLLTRYLATAPSDRHAGGRARLGGRGSRDARRIDVSHGDARDIRYADGSRGV